MSQTEVGWSEGRTRYTGAAENFYERQRRGGSQLSASEYVHVLQGYLRGLPTVDPAATTAGGSA
jgi:hypothetical protein